MSESAISLSAIVGALSGLQQDGVDDAARIDRIRALEAIKAAAAAAQARETAAFSASQRARQAAAGVPDERIGRGIAAQVALARRISPHVAARYVGWATILIRELPRTFLELAAGRTTEWRALLIARETVFLSREHRAVVDAELAPRLVGLGDKRTEAEARKIGYRLDPAGFVARTRAAEADRRVSIRPAPDAMAQLTALLPVAQGVACYAALARAADTTTSGGDERGRGQIMADTLVERVTGQAVAADVPVAVNLVMTDETLLRPESPAGQAPGHVDGYGPVPAEVARDLVHRPGERTPMWLRRLYTAPASGELVAMDSKQRAFTAGQRHFVRLRDQWCRTPWCEAPIRHIDHVLPVEDGGPTSVRNARGGCAGCNYVKQEPGWSTRVIETPDGGHEVETITPTGHTYRSRAPDSRADPHADPDADPQADPDAA